MNPMFLGAAGLAACLGAAAALWPAVSNAHITASPNELPADGFGRIALRVPHGCTGSPTLAVRVRIPEGLIAVKPEVKPGWKIDLKTRKLDKPVELGEGRIITEVVEEVAWRGGPLPDAYFEEFGLVMRVPAAEEGTKLWFPTVQECEQGIHRWIEIPAEGQKWKDKKEPAPFVRLLEPLPVE